MVNQERLRALLHYDPDTGLFTWRVSRGSVKAGAKAATKRNSEGYTSIKIDGRTHSAHRLAWLYVHGYHPPDEIDHINRNPGDNRLENLRLADRFLNNQNTCKHGFYWCKRDKRWIVTLTRNGVRKTIYRTIHEWAAKSVAEFARIDATACIRA